MGYTVIGPLVGWCLCVVFKCTDKCKIKQWRERGRKDLLSTDLLPKCLQQLGLIQT